ncbi:glycerophosphodiester phosphodiesterase [Aminobacter carboxidus]|uniref:Glycerophosphodiester phosphodiesterase n=1 Tax=Aminobacter carboxidus TaxID=376165 RepID=A0A8E1WBB2_9HYPH|nr:MULTISPECIES: glycerophosphodiester phosphodiesterase [Aminobacter carboxidus group]MBB6465108.1 glycerophosphoryl diester phosphodiesterase [Aminobacter lissarensis]MBE1207114.1 glycerophosphodiester phosphodiesterase [Aminobacter carboxidus]
MTDLAWLTARPIAHRGLHDLNKTCWENTLSAFERAAQRGYAIECDVHLTANGDVAVFHDDVLNRLTGTDGFIWQRTTRELAALRVGGTADHVPTLAEMLKLVDGRVPLVIELKGIPGHDGELVERVAAALRNYKGKVAIMSFDHWLIRDFSRHAPGIPAGLTAWGDLDHELEAHFSMLAHGISFVSYSVTHLPNRFVSFVRDKLAMPVITWTVRDQEAVRTTFAQADQMTFEGFDPDAVVVA